MSKKADSGNSDSTMDEFFSTASESLAEQDREFDTTQEGSEFIVERAGAGQDALNADGPRKTAVEKVRN